jgi:hypothetical protein
MDAVKFVEERRRMYTLGCIKKGINDYNMKAEAVVAEVEAWAAAHPRKTRQSVFLEQWPEAELDSCGYLWLCPKRISADCRNRYGNCANRKCTDCHKEFLGQEVE